jgi:processive 1,2-diacylglycerol beta-glucosyltransferase
VVTDYHVHGMWLTRNTDHYFVAGERARTPLVAAGVEAERVTAAGIPISTAFSAPMDRSQLRHKYGLTSEAPVILISAGRIGFEDVRAVADVLVRLNRKLQAILLCGSDTALKQRLDQYAHFEHRGSAVTLHVFGHTGEMHEIMAVSDIIVGRPGGLMVAEALASGLAFFIVGRLPGQEEWNAQYLVDEGAGVRCRDPAMLHRQLTAVLDRPDMLESMKLRARRVARPRAACDIVRTILGWNS